MKFSTERKKEDLYKTCQVFIRKIKTKLIEKSHMLL